MTEPSGLINHLINYPSITAIAIDMIHQPINQ